MGAKLQISCEKYKKTLEIADILSLKYCLLIIFITFANEK